MPQPPHGIQQLALCALRAASGRTCLFGPQMADGGCIRHPPSVLFAIRPTTSVRADQHKGSVQERGGWRMADAFHPPSVIQTTVSFE